MLPAANRGAGMNLGFPDVCNTIVGPATVPIPYPNIAMNAQAAPFSPVVKVSMVNALNMGSKIPMTSGDEAGTAHPTVKGMGAYTMGNPIVHIDRLPAINLTCPTTGNNMNNPVGAVLVPSAVNVLYTYRTAPAGASVDPRADDASSASVPGVSGVPTVGSGVDLGADALAALEASLFAVPPLRPGVLLGSGVAHLCVDRFTADLPTLVFNEVCRLEAAGMRALVLDLRDNPGGDLDAAARLAGDFLPEGTLLVHVRDADGDETILRARPGAPYLFPVVLLVNRDTASAAEIFAGCLKAHTRVLVVGESTHGKSCAQRLLPSLAGPGAVYATVATVLLPGGEEIQDDGLTPDLVISREDPRADAQLDAAHDCAVALLAS
ncbi:S41 family peptidase [Chondromyces apiculatus]|uniref:Carboxyl-terminase protease n=1 Tax=Chondromyces apiculatus DSM 436 TaxID=1192034 RepID=A0A017TJ00_9BACT|nr:S41 family peptidase [Chondromyces apiculatus]EYF08877.1 carboxyl-terminase protease [Chondromyces apiculatus DSM 436]